ncbi:MAG: tetratricopeptide repeat protein [Bacteroidales bacterium]
MLILVISALFIIAFTVAYFYYDYKNQSVDPRVKQANIMYERYNDLTENAEYQKIFLLMDSLENIYCRYPHYRNSYEVGVLYNNRAASYLAMALAQNDSTHKDSLLRLAEKHTLTSIDIYKDWLDAWEGKSENEIMEKLKLHFNPEDTVFKGKDVGRYINHRAKGIREAQFETVRRMSVSYTNLGIIFRHRKNYEAAAREYFKALELWPDNQAAENNLNILMDEPLNKPNILRRLFPKDRRAFPQHE